MTYECLHKIILYKQFIQILRPRLVLVLALWARYEEIGIANTLVMLLFDSSVFQLLQYFLAVTPNILDRYPMFSAIERNLALPPRMLSPFLRLNTLNVLRKSQASNVNLITMKKLPP